MVKTLVWLFLSTETQLYKENPRVFANGCLNAVNNGNGDNIIRMLGEYWGVSAEEVCDVLDEARSDT